MRKVGTLFFLQKKQLSIAVLSKNLVTFTRYISTCVRERVMRKT